MIIILSAERVDLDGRVEHLSQHQNNNQYYSNGFFYSREKILLNCPRSMTIETKNDDIKTF